MNELKRFELGRALILSLLIISHFGSCRCRSSLNAEGSALLKFRDGVVRDPFGALSNWNDHAGEVDPCSWSGIECSDGRVITLNLKDLCLEGILTSELGKLQYIKSISLRNNSFSGSIPVEIAELKELEILDLGYNNFSELFPSDPAGNNLSLSILLLDNNNFLSISPELHKLAALSEFQVDENHLTGADLKPTCNSMTSSRYYAARHGKAGQRMLLQASGTKNPPKANSNRSNSENPPKANSKGSKLSPFPSLSSPSPSPSSFSPSLSPTGSPTSFPNPPSTSISLPPNSPFLSPEAFSPSPSPVAQPSPAPSALGYRPINPKPPVNHHVPMPSPTSTPSQTTPQISKSNHHKIMMWSGVTGGSLFVLFSIFGVLFCRSSKVVTVKPWATGLSGQLQKAFITGVPKLRRSELETACEDFSNIIGTLSDGTVYKGTLSNGVEIAVTSAAVKSAEDWSKKLEARFRKKLDTLSKVNHKNFVNLIGFCEEEKPFTRQMVFEYAPNGTLFEHLHIKEAEHLDWLMRKRIAMGMAYCLEHMHQLKPPVVHENLLSSSVYLTEDYAAKISDFSFWNEATASKMGSAVTELLKAPSADPESNVYSFGIILYELCTGKLPYSVDNGSPEDWASDYLKSERSPREMVDPTLKSFQEQELVKLLEVVRYCVNPEHERRPTMKEVAAMMKEITGIGPDGATPKLSPLWWAELEILSNEAL